MWTDRFQIPFPVAGIEAGVVVPPAVAFGISFFTSMSGNSGVFLLMPFQVSVLGFVSPSVTATNLLCNVVGTPGGVMRYARQKRVAWSLAVSIIVGALPGIRLKSFPAGILTNLAFYFRLTQNQKEDVAMRKILILGAGAGGTIVANMLRQQLPESQWQIVIIDRDDRHHYQAGYLFIPFGVYGEADVLKPKKEFIPPGVEFVVDRVVKIDKNERSVETLTGKRFDYDWLVIATGCDIHPEEVDGMMDGWRKEIFDYYTLEGALALAKQLRYFNSGRIVLNIAEFPYKCPIAPLEFVFMADWFFTVNGCRDKVEIEFVTPLDNVFTKPVAAKALAEVASRKNIKVTPYFDLAQVNASEKTIESHKKEKVGYDLLVSIPPNMGDKMLIDSEISDPVGFVPTDNHTLKAENTDRIYVIGDTTNVPTSKAGSVAHYMAYTLVENLIREIDGYEALPKFDGHATCFLASGFEKAILLDFNYQVEPLPGKFPFPGMGPFTLLKESMSNHWGKMMFRWVYWNLMMKGLDLPLEPQMNLAGKIRQAA